MADEAKRPEDPSFQGQWHRHHDQLAEFTTESIESRREYILAHKPKAEHELRLRLLHRMSPQAERLLAEYDKVTRTAWDEYMRVTRAAWAELEALHPEECPNCPWDGKTIFAEK